MDVNLYDAETDPIFPLVDSVNFWDLSLQDFETVDWDEHKALLQHGHQLMIIDARVCLVPDGLPLLAPTAFWQTAQPPVATTRSVWGKPPKLASGVGPTAHG